MASLAGRRGSSFLACLPLQARPEVSCGFAATLRAPMTIPRRTFVAMTGAAIAAPSNIYGKDEVPSLLDHILLGCKDLESGIAFVEERTGVRAAFGGVHPGRGTQNALLALGTRRYLEIIAPDPKQSGATDRLGLQKLTEPRLVGWAAHPGDLDDFANRLRAAGIAFDGPTPGSPK